MRRSAAIKRASDVWPLRRMIFLKKNFVDESDCLRTASVRVEITVSLTPKCHNCSGLGQKRNEASNLRSMNRGGLEHK